MENNKWKRWLITIVILVLIVIMGITMGGRERITFVENLIGNIVIPIQNGFDFLGDGVANGVRPIAHIWEMDDEISRLEKENQELRQKIIENSLDSRELTELKRIRKELSIINNVLEIDDYVTCNVVGKDNGNWYNMFTINAGTNDGITKDSPVLNGDGLVGRVYEVGSNWAKVVSLIDYKSEIGFETVDSKKGYDGILKGHLDETIDGYLFDAHATVTKGETLITSGLGLYPKGIVIGEISEVIVNEDALLTNIVVTPLVDFKNLDRVMVLKVKEAFPTDYK